MKGITIKILVDNRTSTPLKSEHGLSMLIETPEASILCDMGASDAFLQNAEQMGIDLNKIDFAFISHGHSDHTGGLVHLLNNFPDKKIYTSPLIFKEYYFSGRRGYWRAMSTEHSLLQEYQENFIMIEGAGNSHPDGAPHNSNAPREERRLSGRWVTPSIAIVANSCNRWSRPYGNIYLTKQPATGGLTYLTADPEHLLPDDFRHELSIAATTEKGLVIISSCSHCGALNIMESCMAFTGEKSVSAFVGGLHFIDSPQVETEVETFATELYKAFGHNGNSYGSETSITIPRIITGHCTCDRAKEVLAKKIPGIEFFGTGSEIKF